MKRCLSISGVLFSVAIALLAVASAEASSQPSCFGRKATIMGSAFIPGTAGDDVIVGSTSDDVIAAGGGNDLVCGLDGNDIIRGEIGNDRLDGGAGDDRILGDLAAFAGDVAGHGGNDYILG